MAGLNALGLSVSLYAVLHIFATNQVARANRVPFILPLLIASAVRIVQSFFVYAVAVWDAWFLSTETEEEHETRENAEDEELEILSKYGIPYKFSQVSLATYAAFLVAFPKMFIEMTFNPEESSGELWWSYAFNAIPSLFFGVVYARGIIQLSTRVKGAVLIVVSTVLAYFGGIGSQCLAGQVFETLGWKHEAEQTGDEFIGALGSGLLFAFLMQVVVIIDAWRNKMPTNDTSDKEVRNVTSDEEAHNLEPEKQPLVAGKKRDYQTISTDTENTKNSSSFFKPTESDRLLPEPKAKPRF